MAPPNRKKLTDMLAVGEAPAVDLTRPLILVPSGTSRLSPTLWALFGRFLDEKA
jgi:hypothetical protein